LIAQDNVCSRGNQDYQHDGCRCNNPFFHVVFIRSSRLGASLGYWFKWKFCHHFQD
jgi:hypothetical protein